MLLEPIGGAAQIAAHLLLGPVPPRWRRRWRATPAEIARTLPGDELIPRPGWRYDHAITIDAPRGSVWPWLVQLGQGRGGFYSYERLENLVGCDIHDVLEIRPELQHLAVGDVVRMHASGFGPSVAHLDPERALVLGSPPDGKGSGATRALYLFDGPKGTTRLLERGRQVAGKGLVARPARGPYLIDPVGFVMSRKMLRTNNRLAETAPRTARARGAGHVRRRREPRAEPPPRLRVFHLGGRRAAGPRPRPLRAAPLTRTAAP